MPTNSLSEATLKELRNALQQCTCFKSDSSLADIFVDSRISLWHNNIPNAVTLQNRINALVPYLLNKANNLKQNGLVLFLNVLSGHFDIQDSVHFQLRVLAKIIEKELDIPSIPKIPRVKKSRSLGLARKMGKPTAVVLAHNLLIVSTENSKWSKGIIHALDTTDPYNMSESWQHPLSNGGIARFPQFVPEKDIILISPSFWVHPSNSNKNALIALDAKTGAERWSYRVQGSLSTPVVYDNNVFVTTDASPNKRAILISLDEPEKPVWIRPFPFDWRPHMATATDDGFYVAVRGKGVVYYELEHGQQASYYSVSKTEGSVEWPPIVTNKNVIVATDKGWLIAFNRMGTEPSWKVHVGSSITVGPINWEDRVFVAYKKSSGESNNYRVSCLEVDGSFKWSFATDKSYNQIHAPLYFCDNKLFFGTDNGELYSLNAFTGESDWLRPYQTESQKGIQCKPTIDQAGNIYVADRNAQVICITLEALSSDKEES